jgi:uncharacterized protein with HEPN domain
MKTDKLYVDQILDSISKIESFVEGFDFDKFEKDQKTQSAVILQLALIGELSKKISNDTKSKTNLPWTQIIGFRNRAIHDYINVELNVVWNTIFVDLPMMKKEVENIFS